MIVIGGGDTGSDCVGTSNRQGAASVTQLEIMPQPTTDRPNGQPWPTYPMIFRVSSAHEEGGDRVYSVSTKEFIGEKGQLKAIKTVKLQWEGGRMTEVPGSEEVIECDLVFLAMGFVSPVSSVLESFGVDQDARGNAKAATEGAKAYATGVDKVFAAGDMRRGQSLVVWAIREGRQAARAVDQALMGQSLLPR